MEADFFTILRLRPGRYSPTNIDRQYGEIRREILRAGGPDCQRKLDDAMIAHAMLRDSRRQSQLAQRPRLTPKTPAAAPDKVAFKSPKPLPLNKLRVISPSASPARPVPSSSASADTGVYGRFAKMVLQHVESGLLRYTARARLMLLAKGLGIGEFKANLIIAEVLHDLQEGRVEALRASSRPCSPASRESMPPVAAPRETYPLIFWAGVAAVLAGIVDAILILWLQQ